MFRNCTIQFTIDIPMTSETSELIQISEGVESIPERHYEDCDQNHTKRICLRKYACNEYDGIICYYFKLNLSRYWLSQKPLWYYSCTTKLLQRIPTSHYCKVKYTTVHYSTLQKDSSKYLLWIVTYIFRCLRSHSKSLIFIKI